MIDYQPLKILITSGATAEPIDSVRFIGNKSSGKVGYQLAIQGAIAGHQITLLQGQNAPPPTSHPRLNTTTFTTSRDLKAKCMEYLPSNDVVIMAAAVSDFTLKGGCIKQKIQRSESMSLDFVATEDIVAELVSKKRADQTVIGFALADSSQLQDIAKTKMKRKGLDAIVANPIQTMDSDIISATIHLSNGTIEPLPPKITKPNFAQLLIDFIPTIRKVT